MTAAKPTTTAGREHRRFLEAKCYDPDGNGVGVKQVMRLISRIRHRQFGVFVTTAFIHRQAYEEVREDEHPVVFLSGRDIVYLLRRMGLTDSQALASYLTDKYPVSASSPKPSVDVAVPDPSLVIEVLDREGTDAAKSVRLRS
nr:restriction endonuclease [Microlunatus phosphovorus]